MRIGIQCAKGYDWPTTGVPCSPSRGLPAGDWPQLALEAQQPST